MQHEYDTNQSKIDLARYRIESAKVDLSDAELLYNNKSYKGANNRAYYAIYHAISAVFAIEGKSFKKHRDAIANFNKEYIKTGTFEKSIGRRINNAFEIRQASDYNDFYIAKISDVEEQIKLAEEMIEIISNYIGI